MVTFDEVKSKTTERFWQKIKAENIYDCWEWKAKLNDDGYGAFTIRRNGKKAFARAPRIMFFAMFPDTDIKLCVLHKCDNPSCVNPNHLWLGTKGDNNKDRDLKGRTRTGHNHGELNGSSKLNERKVIEIRKLYSEGNTYEYIAKIYSVDLSTIGLVVRRKTWKYVK